MIRVHHATESTVHRVQRKLSPVKSHVVGCNVPLKISQTTKKSGSSRASESLIIVNGVKEKLLLQFLLIF